MSNRDVLVQSLACFADPNRRAQYLDLYAPDAVLHGYQGVEPGRESIGRFYRALWEAFPDAQVHLEDVFEQGDRICCRFVMTGTQRGAFQGIPPTNRAIALPGITILRFENGQCVERWSQADFLGLLGQLGALGASV